MVEGEVYTKEEKKIQQSTVQIEPVVSIPYVQNKFLEAKKEYIANPDVTLSELAEKYNINPQKLMVISKEQNWDTHRATVYAKADTKMQEGMVDRFAEVNEKHVKISQFVLNLAVQAMKSYKENPAEIGPKNALAYLVSAVKMQREALGMAKEQPKIVNIITQQQAIINKYKKNSMLPDTVVTEKEEDG